MINDNVVIKWINKNPSEEDYKYRINKFNSDILRIKLGFPGIGNRHLSLIDTFNIKRGDKIVWDYYLGTKKEFSESNIKISPKIFQIVSLSSVGDDHTSGILIGIGDGNDNENLLIGKTYLIDNIHKYSVILRLDSIGRYKSIDKRSF